MRVKRAARQKLAALPLVPHRELQEDERGHAVITNTSDRLLVSPVGLVIESISDPSVTLANSDGTTHDGKEYIDLSGLLGDGQLDPDESVSTRIYFNNPSRARFTIDPSVRGMILP